MYICPLLYVMPAARSNMGWLSSQTVFHAKNLLDITKRAQQSLSEMNAPVTGVVAISQWPTMIDIANLPPFLLKLGNAKSTLNRFLNFESNKSGRYYVYLQKSFFYSLVTASSRQGTSSIQTPRKAYDLGISFVSSMLRNYGPFFLKPPCKRRCTHGYEWDC